MAGTTFDVVGKPSDLAVGGLGGMGQYGVLRGIELDGHDVILICCGMVMNALFGGEAKQYLLGLRNKSVLRDFCLRGFGHGRTQLDTRLERGLQGIARTLQTATSWKSRQSLVFPGCQYRGAFGRSGQKSCRWSWSCQTPVGGLRYLQ
ncbi:MAG: hypothetical protein K9K38_18885 [Rhodoferax sp.]|nr:hypothetical protein [Rhodoferax sp.]